MASPFFGGMAKTILKSWEARDADERDLKKYEALERLRRETSDYEFGRRVAYEATQADKDLSYIDDDTGERVLLNSQNQEIGRNKLTAAQRESRRVEREKEGLEVKYKQAQLDNFAADNARADRQLDIQAAGLAESRLDRAERRASSRAEREKEGGDKAPLYAKANRIYANINSLPVSPSQKLAAREKMTEAINAGKGSAWLDKFEEGLYKSLRSDRAIDKYSAEVASDKLLEQIMKDNAGN